MTDFDNEFNLDELEKMSQEGLDHFNNKKALTDIESEVMSKVNTGLDQGSSVKYLKPLAFAALLASLAILLFILFGNQEKSQKLYASNYNTPQFLLSSTERTADAELEPIFSIKNLYAQGKFSDCLKAMEAQNGTVFSQYPDLRLYQGICHLEIGEPNKAIKVLSSPSNELEDVRTWHLALAYLAADQKEQSIATLESLIKLSSNYKKTEATSLLSKLKT